MTYTANTIQAVIIDPMDGIVPLLNRTEMQNALEKAISASKVFYLVLPST